MWWWCGHRCGPSVSVSLPLSRHNQLSQSADQLTTHSIPPASPPSHFSLLVVVEWQIQNFHIRKLFLGVPGTSTTTGLWSPPLPGSLNHNPSWQHSAWPRPLITALTSPTSTTSQPLAPAHVETKPSVVPAQAAASSSSQPRLLFPGSLRTAAVTRPDNTQQLRRRRQRCTVYRGYSVYSTVGTVPMNVEESWGGGMSGGSAPPAPCPLHPLTIWGARPGPSPGGDNDAEIRISCILYLVSCILCCVVTSSHLICSAPALTTLRSV